MKDANDPVVLSGRIYVSGLLAYDRPDLEVPGDPVAGSLKILAVPTDRSRDRNPEGLEHYTGYFSAYIYNGKRWRKFNLRAGAAVDARYVSNGDRKCTLDRAVAELRKLKDRTSVWGNRAYEVCVLPKPAPAARVRKEAKKSARKDDGKSKGGGVQLLLFDD